MFVIGTILGTTCFMIITKGCNPLLWWWVLRDMANNNSWENTLDGYLNNEIGVLRIAVHVLRFLSFPAGQFSSNNLPIWAVSPLWGFTIASMLALIRKGMPAKTT